MSNVWMLDVSGLCVRVCFVCVCVSMCPICGAHLAPMTTVKRRWPSTFVQLDCEMAGRQRDCGELGTAQKKPGRLL